MLKLVKALDLQHWADTKESEALMPELMRRLVHASLKEITYVSFPNEDNVYMPGFDCEKWRGMACYWGDPTNKPINKPINKSINKPINKSTNKYCYFREGKTFIGFDG